MNTVHFGVIKMNIKNISKEKLLLTSQDILLKEGVKGLSIRNIAKEANVSVGSIYKYFSTKLDILIELESNYWNAIISKVNDNEDLSFEETIELEYRLFLEEKSPIFNLLNHGKLFENDELKVAIEKMDYYKNQLKEIIYKAILNDKNLIHTDDLVAVKETSDLIFNTIILDATKNSKTYKRLILLVKNYFN
jgi:AcrR family transcriptional regulator